MEKLSNYPKITGNHSLGKNLLRQELIDTLPGPTLVHTQRKAGMYGALLQMIAPSVMGPLIQNYRVFQKFIALKRKWQVLVLGLLAHLTKAALTANTRDVLGSNTPHVQRQSALRNASRR
jgi:hypothetical protein